MTNEKAYSSTANNPITDLIGERAKTCDLNKTDKHVIYVGTEALQSIIQGEADRFGITVEQATELFNTAGQLGVTTARLHSMRKYAALLKVQNPRWSEEKVKKKVAKQFNIELT